MKLYVDNKEIIGQDEIKKFLLDEGIVIYEVNLNLKHEEIAESLEGFNFKEFDLVEIDDNFINWRELRNKFLRPHTHIEDEIRVFLDGQGLFYFGGKKLFCLHCEKGDAISVPAHREHWFDGGERPFFKVMRLFTDSNGWTPNYTGNTYSISYEEKI